jgi:NAD(P)-dependent dehydrogenase (short-subunit alcohol dehydrogenase family)
MGYAIAKRLLARGVDTLICARQSERLEAAQAELDSEAAARCEALGLDLTRSENAEKAVDACVERFGGIDILVNNAGVAEYCEIQEITAESWERSQNLMARAPVLATKAAAVHMAARGGGRVINNASISGSLSEPGSAQYSAAKAATISFTKTAAVDLAPLGIRANAIAPGWIRTPLSAPFFDGIEPDALKAVNPLGRVGDPDEVAVVAEFLALDAPDFLTGETIHVDGGQAIYLPLP